MDEIRYMISDAAKKVNVEAHVLRYWEEELNLSIARNEMGHRYYTGNDIEKFINVKNMKEKGFQLKAIKMVLLNGDAISPIHIIEEVIPQMMSHGERAESNVQTVEKQEIVKAEATQTEKAEKQLNAKLLLKNIIQEVIKDNNKELSKEVGIEVGDRVLKQMDYLFREQEEREEDRFKKFDELLRMHQKNGALKKLNMKKEKKRGFFGKEKSI